MDSEVVIDHDKIVHRTELAILFRIDEDEVWVPKSIISDMDDDTFTVPEWFAFKGGLT